MLHGPPTPDTRQMVPEAFTRRFGIPVEYNALRSAGLILPEVTDPAVWTLDADDRFLDPEHNKLMRLFYSTTAVAALNRDYADPASIKVANDLLRPELKSKISVEDPTVPGSGANVAAYYYLVFGEPFVRKLYGEQAVSSQDNRQRADWLIRGTQPIALSLSAPEVDRTRNDGFPVQVIRSFDDAAGLTGSAFGVAALVAGAPHPNAAKLFVNWIASREGVEVFSRAERLPGTRRDVDYTPWVPEYTIPLPGVSYLDTYNWDWTARQQPAAAAKLKEILGGR